MTKKPQTRKVQHRPNREPTKVQEISELRQENKQLKRQLSRLRKENERLKDEASPEVQEDTMAIVPEPVEQEHSDEGCPECGAFDIGTVQTPGGKTITACRSCKKWRKIA